MPTTRRFHGLGMQLGWRLAGLILALLVVLLGLGYTGLRALALDAAGAHLQRQVGLRALQLGQPLEEGQHSVLRLHEVWQERAAAAAADRHQLRQRFEQRFERSSDGVWRLRPGWLDPLRRPTFYLQHGADGPDDSVRLRALLSYELLTERGPALVPPYFSAYVDFVEKGLMVYSKGIDWGRSATPQTDNHDYPTMQGSRPDRNPQRRLFWTPVYFDGEAKTWMVSVIQPLDWQGRWVGTVGHDIALDGLLDSISRLVEPGYTAMIIDEQGALIAHPQLRERIAGAQGQLALAAVNDPLLHAIWQRLRDSKASGAQLASSADGRHLIAWARMPGTGWWTVETVPVAHIERGMRWLGLGMLALGLAVLALSLWALQRLLARKVQAPLERLEHGLAGLAGLGVGGRPVPLALPGDDELAQLGRAFDSMADELATQREREQAQAQTLRREVDERQQAEAALRELNESLERRIEARTLELREANGGLQQSLVQLRQTQEELVQKETLAGLGALVAGVSHELNTPLGNALIAADTAQVHAAELQLLIVGDRLRRSELQRLVAATGEASRLALGNLQRSVELVRGFKQVAVDRAGLQRRRFRLHEVTDEVLDLLRIVHKRTPFRIVNRLPAELELDSYPGAYGQVITNLVQNALLHGFEGRAHGEVRISLIGSDAAALWVEVADDGHGIAAEHIAQVFKPFFTTRLGQGGSGLGLHIVYTLVGGALGGRIEVESPAGGGSCFRFSLARVAPAAD